MGKRIFFFILLIIGLIVFYFLQNQKSNEKFVAQLDENIEIEYALNWDGSGEMYDQIILIKKNDKEIKLQGKTPVRELQVYLDSYPIDGVDVKMIFIYDLYLGWAIINYNDFTIWKDFTTLPTKQELLVKLRLIENPILDFDGTQFNHRID